MREFFKGWRRKFGVVTLVMACVVMIGWACSCVDNGQLAVILAINRQQHWIFIEKEGVQWLRWPLKENECGEAGMDSFRMLPSIVENVFFPEVHLLPLRLHEDGFTKTTVPIWWIAATFTLLSAYLLLWKPRKRTGPEHA